jgi:hypothetical protein
LLRHFLSGPSSQPIYSSEPCSSVTSWVRKFLIGSLLTLAIGAPTALRTEGFDPTAEEILVTAEELDSEHADYDEGAVDLKGAALFKQMQIHGAEGFTPEQIPAAEGYQSRYENAPFFVISNLWILLCAFLVFIMHLGFACLESGLTQKKNTVNILFKSVFIICAGILLYAA